MDFSKGSFDPSCDYPSIHRQKRLFSCQSESNWGWSRVPSFKIEIFYAYGERSVVKKTNKGPTFGMELVEIS